MADDLTFYTNPMSRGRIARWMLEEVGHPYETVLLDFGPAMKAPEYRALNPMGKVPTIVHGETVVTECAAICAYLADAFPEAGLAPETGAPRRLLPLAVLRRRPARGRRSTNQSLGVEVPKERRGMVGYGSLPPCSTRWKPRSPGLHRRRPLHRRRRLRRRPDRLGPALRHHRAPPGLHRLLGAHQPAPRRAPRHRDRRRRHARRRRKPDGHDRAPDRGRARARAPRPRRSRLGRRPRPRRASARSGSSRASPRPGASCPAPRSPPRSSTTTPIGPTATTSST